MTKQEEIREGLGNIEFLGLEGTFYLQPSAITKIFQYLHSQGVVIKVDGELPTIPLVITSLSWDKWQELMKQGIKEAGYVAVEPLIERG